MAQDAPARKSGKKRLVKALAALMAVAIVALAALPWLLGTSAAKGWLLGRINASLAPSRVEADAFRFSWNGPIRIEGLVLKGADGEVIVAAPAASCDRGLWQLLTDRPRYGTITLEGAKLDLERRKDGSINLARALGFGAEAPAPHPAPAAPAKAPGAAPDVTLKVVNGSLRLRSPELPEPLVADRFDLTVDVPVSPNPLTWQVAMAKPGGETLGISGRLEKASGDLAVDLTANRWPTAYAGSGVAVRGRLDGKLGIRRKSGLLDLAGDARLIEAVATGKALGGDRIDLDAFGGTWDVSQGPAGWSIRRLDLTGPLASLASKGAIPAAPGSPAVIEGKIDLASLARQAPHAFKLRDGIDLQSGSVVIRVNVQDEAGAQRLDVKAKVSDLVARERGRAQPIVLRDPATVTANLLARGAEVRVERLGVVSDWLVAEGAGSLDRGVHLVASLDLAGLERQARDLVDLKGVGMAGKGRFEADYRRDGTTYAAKLSGEIRNLAATGLTADPLLRDVVKISAEAKGGADVSGLPITWRTARLDVRAPDLATTATVSPKDDGLGLALNVVLPLALADGAGRASARVVGLWHGSALEIGELHAAFQPPGRAPALAFSGRGRFDRASGMLMLSPPAVPVAETLTLGPGGLRASGLNGGGDWKVEADLSGDLAALDRAQAAFLGGAAKGVDGPFALAVTAAYAAKADRLNLTRLNGATRYANFGLLGSIVEFSGRSVADIGGVLVLDKPTLDAFVASAVAPDARVTATARPVHLRGPLAGGDVLKAIEVEAGLDIAEARACGLRLGPAAIVAHLAGGKVAIDPITATLNDGKVTILSELTLDDPKGAAFRILPGTEIRDATIDDEVSQRLLAYVAPVLEDATQVSGKVSVALQRAELPLGGAADRQVTLAGQLQFVDLTFGPGPMARQVLDLATLKGQPEVRLNETIQVAVSDRRVYQKGLTIPVGKKEAVSVFGSVGFDGTLQLQADIPLPTAELAKRAGIDLPQDSARVPVQIGGTMAHPTIDRRALANAIKKQGRSSLKREAESGASELLRRLAAPENSPSRRR